MKIYKSVFSNHIKSLGNLDSDTLSKHGYTSDQIEVINTFNGSEDQMRLLSAEVNGSGLVFLHLNVKILLLLHGMIGK